MVRQVNYGLIGCGMMGQEHIRNIALVPGARVTVVHDPVREQAETVARGVCASLARRPAAPIATMAG